MKILVQTPRSQVEAGQGTQALITLVVSFKEIGGRNMFLEAPSPGSLA